MSYFWKKKKNTGWITSMCLVKRIFTPILVKAHESVKSVIGVAFISQMSQFIVQITVFNAIVHSTVQNPM
jgi:hypothetical protein